MKSPVNARRLLAGVFLGAALLMLILGMTALSNRLEGKNFLTFWLICFLFTGLAAIFAMFDLVAVRRQSREAQRDLIKETLEKTSRDANKFDPTDLE